MPDVTRTPGGRTQTTKNIGAANEGAGAVAVEWGDDVLHQTVITLTDLEVALSDANVGGGTKIYDFPEGRILILGAVAKVNFTTTSTLSSTLNAGVTLSWGVGTVQTTTQGSGTLATTQQDIIPATAATASATIDVAGADASAALAASAQFDGTATPKDAYLNIGVPTATDIDGDATVDVNGTVTITWAYLGDV